jgi:hypothetical protein
MKQKGHNFDPIEVIEAESQAVMNTWRVLFASMPKVSFDQMAAPVPEIMDGSV